MKMLPLLLLIIALNNPLTQWEEGAVCSGAEIVKGVAELRVYTERALMLTEPEIHRLMKRISQSRRGVSGHTCLSVTVSTSKPKVEIHEHTDAVLSCEFKTEKDQNPRIEWKKKGKGVTFVYFDKKFAKSYTGRAKIDGATLTIHSVTQKDSGEYRCEVTATEDHVNLGEATVTLNVLVPPHVPSCEVPDSVFVGAGLELLCKDKLSVPPATYRWYKDNKALTATGDAPYSIDTNKGTLKFKSVSKEDTGMYRCESSNSVGAPKSCVAKQLTVVEYPWNMTMLIAGASGFVALVLFCCICICICRRRGCCMKSRKTKSTKSYNPPPPPPPPPGRSFKHYKQTQSFMI